MESWNLKRVIYIATQFTTLENDAWTQAQLIAIHNQHFFFSISTIWEKYSNIRQEPLRIRPLRGGVSQRRVLRKVGSSNLNILWPLDWRFTRLTIRHKGFNDRYKKIASIVIIN